MVSTKILSNTPFFNIDNNKKFTEHNGIITIKASRKTKVIAAKNSTCHYENQLLSKIENRYFKL